MLQLPGILSAIFAILCYSSTVILCSSEVQDYKYISIKLLTNLDQPCPYTELCLTLEQFSENANQYYGNTSLTLEFLPGDHWLTSSVTVHNVSNLTLFSQTADANIICSSHFAYFKLTDITIAQLTHLTFLGCGPGDNIYVTSALAALDIFSVSNLNIKECKFHNSKRRVVDAMFCNITIYKSEFINSSKGVLFTAECHMSDIGSFYYNNAIDSYTAFDSTVSSSSSVLIFNSCKFHSNDEAFWITNTTINLYLSELTNNRTHYGVFLAQYSNIKIESTCIKENVVLRDILNVFQSSVSLINTTILGNIAKYGHVLSARKSTLQLESYELQDILIAANIGENTISFSESQVNITGKLIFVNNSGTFLISNSKVRFFNATTFQSCTGSATTSTAFVHAEGGAFTAIGSKVWFYDSVLFLNNSSNDVGGGLCAYGSNIYIIKNIQVGKNQAKESGGGIFLYRSSFICTQLCNIFENRPIGVTNGKSSFKGGGIYAFDSKIILGSECTDSECASESITVLFLIKDNFAVEGGGMYLEANSMLLIPKDINYRLIFEHNQATKGGAMYINDDTYLGTCNGFYVQCFLQVSLPIVASQASDSHVLDSQIQIIGKVTENTLFGGLLDKCYINDAFRGVDLTKGIDYLKTMTNDKNISGMITSKAVRIQFCQLQSSTKNITIKKGEYFNVQVVALDQVNHSVEASISSHLNLSSSYLEKDQYTQSIPANCTSLSFNAHSLNNTETLYISPKSQCSNKENGKAFRVHITFEECTCPMGFYVLRSRKYTEDCKCACDPRISPYAELSQCNLSSVVRKNDYWISYSNETGFLVHPFCPYDFCLLPSIPVSIDLNIPNGSDTQCAFNRTGLLCGKCKSGYSLSLSSSHCLKCPEINWPWALLIIIAKIIAGVVLVVSILVLNLTVSVGTLNGLIFYANVFAADSSLFLSFTEQNFFTVFLAWLNLDLGIDVCYFKDIDAYAKAWLNIMFPIYVITVLILIILVSKYSSRFGEFIGRWNPVATLATLLLLSYTKLLQAIITILAFTIITYPTGQRETVWLQDASVKFFSVKHLPLSLLAIIIVILGFIYTVLLFSWQWLLRLPNRRIFKWIRNTRLNLFMEANLAPYKAKYRYWYGLHLFIRMALYLGIATEKSHESVTIILVIGLIAASILLLRTFLGNDIYRKRFVGYLNSSFYYNLLALSLVRLFCQNSTLCQERASKISITLAFILFVLILSYHILRTLLEIRCFRYPIASIEQMLHLRKLRIRLIDDPSFKKSQESEMQETGVILPTSTEVTLSPSKYSSDHKEGGKCVSKFSPDGECCSMQESDSSSADQSSVASKETTLNENENDWKQKIHRKGKRWTNNSNTLREPLLQES